MSLCVLFLKERSHNSFNFEDRGTAALREVVYSHHLVSLSNINHIEVAVSSVEEDGNNWVFALIENGPYQVLLCLFLRFLCLL